MEQVKIILDHHHMVYLIFSRSISRDPNMFVCMLTRKISTAYDSFDIAVLITRDTLLLHEDCLLFFFFALYT